MAHRRISAVIGVFAFVAVLAMAAVTVMNRVPSAPVDTNAFISMSFAATTAVSTAAGDMPAASEPEFNDRFAQEKRSAKIDDLPAQF